VTPFSVGVLVALFERAVGYYASLVGINAYHQPGVEAGKKAATAIIDLELRILRHLGENPNAELTVEDICSGIGKEDEIEIAFKICEQLAANPERGVVKMPGASVFEARYRKT
jgi:glucose-6-phosphate isomerase